MCTLSSADIRRSVNHSEPPVPLCLASLHGQEFLLQDCTGKLSLSSRVAICGRTDVLRCMAGSLGQVPDMDASKKTLYQCVWGFREDYGNTGEKEGQEPHLFQISMPKDFFLLRWIPPEEPFGDKIADLIKLNTLETCIVHDKSRVPLSENLQIDEATPRKAFNFRPYSYHHHTIITG